MSCRFPLDVLREVMVVLREVMLAGERSRSGIDVNHWHDSHDLPAVGWPGITWCS
jgi:hypothetical protein